MLYRFNEPLCNEDIKALLNNELENSSLTHALLLEGAQGSGRKTLAKHLACALACKGFERPCLECRDCKRILDGKCTDITYIGVPEDKKTISVGQIRDIRSDAYIIPGELDFKMYIITDAEKMTVEAQNAFLKILEEPPRYVYFILICESSALLLPTVKSRTQNLRMEAIPPEKLEELVCERVSSARSLRENNRDSFDNAIRTCKGSYGLLCEKIKRSSRKNAAGEKNIASEVLRCLAESDEGALLALANEIPSDRNEYRMFLDSLLGAVRDVADGKNGIGRSISIPSRDVNALVGLYSERKLIALYNILSANRNENDFNTNINLSCLKLLLSMRKALRS